MTLLVRGVHIVGGTGPWADPVDIYVNGDKISAIGNFPNKKADTVIDGLGGFISPGFIDINSESDHYLTIFDQPRQDHFLRQGITTIVGGQEGASLAPLLYGSLESLEEWTHTERVNVDWHTVEEFFRTMQRRPLGVNFATLVGHSTVRRALIGDHVRDLVRNELNVFGRVVRESLDAGAFGLSFGLKSVYGRNTPYAEMRLMGNIVGERQRLLTLSLRKARGLSAAIEEVVRLSREIKTTTIINNFLPIKDQGAEFDRALTTLDEEPEGKLYFDIAPFEASIRPLYRFLPDWAQVGSIEVMAKNLASSWLEEKLLHDLRTVIPVDFMIVKAIGNEALVGHSLKTLMEYYSMNDVRHALLRLMRSTNLKALVAYKNVDGERIDKALVHPRSLVASRGFSFAYGGRAHIYTIDLGSAPFIRFLRSITENNLMPLDTAIAKITRTPARLLGLQGRGEIREGFFADLVVFKNDGIRHVIVNGRVALRDGIVQENALWGKSLRADAR